MLNRLYIVIGLLAILAISAAFVAPRFIQWGDYRERMQAIGSEVLGAPVEIVGEIEFSLLPQPQLVMSDVVVGPAGQPAITVRRVEAQFSLVEFLRDRYLITRLVLDQPVLQVGVDATGGIAAGIELAEQVTTSNVSVASAQIVDGQIGLTDARSGRSFAASNIDGELRLDALRGPFAFQGSGEYDGSTYAVRVTTDALDTDGTARIAALARQPDGAFSLSTEGTLTTAAVPSYAGTVTYRQTPTRAGGTGEEDIGRGDLVVTGKIEATPARVLLSDYTVLPDENRAATRLQGAAEITLGREAAFNAVISGAAVALPPRDVTAEREVAPYELVRLLAELPLPPTTGIAGTVGIDIGEIDLRAVALRNVRLDASTDGEAWSIETLAAQLPGGARMRMSGRLAAAAGRPEFIGDLTLSSQRLNTLADIWRKPEEGTPLVNTSGALRAQISLVGETLSLSRGELTVGDATHSVRAEIGFANGTRHFNVGADLGAMDAVGSQTLLALLPDLAQDERFGVTFPKGRIEATAETVTIAGMGAARLAVSGNWEGGVLVLDRLAADDFGGAAFDVEITAFGTLQRPEFSGSGRVAVGDADAPALGLVLDAVAAPQHVRQFLARSLPAEVEFRLEAPSGEGGQGLSLSGRAGAADLVLQAHLGRGVLRALDGPLAVKLELDSADPQAMTAQLGLGDQSLVPDDGAMHLVAVVEGTAANSFETTVRIDGGGDSLGFAGNVVVGNPDEWSGNGTVKVALSDASVLMEALGAAGVGVPQFSGSADVSFQGARSVRLAAIEAESGGQPVTGSLALSRQNGTGTVSGELEVGELDAAGLLAVIAGPAALIGAGQGTWPDGPLDLGATSRSTSGRVAIRSPAVRLGGDLEVADVRFDLDWDANATRLREFKGGLGDGQVAMELSLCCSGSFEDKQVSGRLTLTDVVLDHIAPAAVADALDGTIDSSAKFEGTGNSVRAVIDAMTGEGSYTVEDLKVARLDPGAFAAIGGLEMILEMERDALSEIIVDRLDDGPFVASTATGGFTIAGGVFRSPNLAIEGQGARLFGSTSVRLADLSLGGGYVMSPRAGAGSGELMSHPSAQIVANLDGTLPAPERQFDVSGMVDGLMVRAYEVEVARLEQLRAEDEARQRAAAEERARIAAEVRAQQEAADAAKRAEVEAAARAAEEAAAARREQEAAAAQREEEAAAARREAEAARLREQQPDQPLDLGLPVGPPAF